MIEMSRPSVSIVIPCFNGSRYLGGLAGSLSKLRGEFLEIIFVDDGSADESADIFSRLVPDAQIIRQTNSGVAAARNAGAAAASGEFLQLLDADDVILPGKLAQQATLAAREGLDVVYSSWQMVVRYPDRVVREPLRDTPMPTEPVAALLSGWWIPPHAYLIRREAYEQIGGSDAGLINAQDFDVVLRLAIAGATFGHLPVHYADYYRYPDITSLARGPRRQYYSDYEKAVEKAVALLARDGGLTLSRRRAASQKLHSIARSVYGLDKAWFRRLVFRIYELDPDFRTSGSQLYGLVSRVAGLAASEAIAARTRRARALLFAGRSAR
jgi:glycosyltransferase involved in cell wall biosynthesis